MKENSKTDHSNSMEISMDLYQIIGNRIRDQKNNKFNKNKKKVYSTSNLQVIYCTINNKHFLDPE